MAWTKKADFMRFGGVMSRKKKRTKRGSDEIEFDLDKLSEYMHGLKPGQYAYVDEMIRKCAPKQELEMREMSDEGEDNK